MSIEQRLLIIEKEIESITKILEYLMQQSYK